MASILLVRVHGYTSFSRNTASGITKNDEKNEEETKNEAKRHKKSSKYLPESILHQISHHFHWPRSGGGTTTALDSVDPVYDCDDVDETIPYLID